MTNITKNIRKQMLVTSLSILILVFSFLFIKSDGNFEKSNNGIALESINKLEQNEELVIAPICSITPLPPPEPEVKIKAKKRFLINMVVDDSIDINHNQWCCTPDNLPEEKLQKKDESDEIHTIYDELPEFPEGETTLNEFIANNLEYPELAKENDIEGRVYVRFEVTKIGNIEKVSIVRGVDKVIDVEAIKVVKKLPRFKPGKIKGEPVNVWFTVPVNFRLEENK